MTREELAIKVDAFIAKYQGQEKGYPNDTSYKGECLSLVKIYIAEVFGITPPPSGTNSAYGYWSNFPNPLPTVFEKVDNTPTNKPEKGDIPIWNTQAGGGFGHIAICVNSDVNTFTSFDQNWGGRQAHLQAHDYTNVVGWLKPRNVMPDEGIVWTDQTRIPIGGEWGEVELQRVRSLLVEMQALAGQVKGLTVELEGQKILVKTLTEQLNKPPEVAVIVKEPVFTTSLAQYLYRWAKSLG